MRASEFTKPTVTESDHMDADQVLQYVKKTHAPGEFNIEYSITDHPAWELKNIPISQLNLDPDGEEQDPYNRTNWVDYDVVRDLMPKIVQVLKSKPIVVDADGWIIDGNHRAMAAAEAGLTSVPALVPAEVKEDVNESREEFEGITIEMEKPFDGKLIIRALDDWGNNILGFVVFNIGDNNELDPQDLSVDTRYQGQGIAKAMYDYVKSLGYTINRSLDQTDAGAGFWNKHRGEDVRVWESFDRPYPVEFEHSEYGDVDALTRLPDGTYLSIMFNQESGHDGTHPGHWSVEFYRNNSQEVTGEGDAQKVFATVIEAIRQFVIKMKPGSISFSASKEPEADMAQPGANVNPESRAKLYNRLVQRYAGSMGYSVQQQEGNGKVTYTLKQARKGVAEARKNPEQNTKYQSGWAELAAWARKNNVWLKPHEWAISMTYVPKLGINPGPGISEDTPRGIYFYPFQWAYSVKMDKEALPWADNAPYIQLFQYSTGTELYDPNQIPLASAVAQLKHYGITDEDIAAEKENDPSISTYNLLVWCLGRKYDDNKRVSILNKVLRNLGYDYMIDNGKGWIAINEPTQGVVLNPKIIDKVVTFNNYTRKKEQDMAEGSLNESAVFLNPTTVVVGQAHGQPLELSPDTLKKIQDIAAKHGAWYEGNGTDRSYTKGQIDRYVGSWDDEVAKSASPNDPKWLYVLFANVDENNRVQRVGVDPKDTIFNRLLAGAQDNSFQGIGYTAQALQKFLQMASEGKYDFVKMSQRPATQENLTRFLRAGEALMWPSNWEQYPNRAGKIAKAATVDVRDQYLATRKAGVYVTGSGHLKAVQNITGQQGVAENFADGKNPVKFTVTTPDGYTHSFQITLAVHGKHVGHFNFVRSADTDDVNNEAEVESRWQGQGYGKLLLMKAIDVANNHGLDFQQDIRGITDAQQNVYDSLENAGLIVTPGDGFWFLTPQGEQELNGLNENFADGKNPGRKGLAKRSGVNTKASVSSLRKTAKNSSGEKQRMSHWLANMKAGRAKAKRK